MRQTRRGLDIHSKHFSGWVVCFERIIEVVFLVINGHVRLAIEGCVFYVG